MLFYKNKADGRLVQAIASNDSKQIHIVEKDGSESTKAPEDFSKEFDLVKPQPDSFDSVEPVAEEVPPVESGDPAPKGKKSKADA